MRIIFASKFYYHRGGLESYLFKAKGLLESYGHEVIPFSTDYYQNYKSEYSKYFCKYYELSKNGVSNSFTDKIKAVTNMYFNREAYCKMQQLIKKTEPDLVQGFGVAKHLSYSILTVPDVFRISL